MNELKADLSNTYTDSPRLSSNLILSSLQLLVWLFFHPSAWQNYLARIDDQLHPNFALGSLSRNQWCNPEIQWLLLRAYMILPLCTSLLVGIILLAVGRPPLFIVFGTVITMTLGFGGGIIGSLVLGIAAGIACSIIVGLSGGIVVGIGIDPATELRGVSATTHAFNFALMYGLGGSVFGHVMGSVTRRVEVYSLTRRLQAIIFGVLIGSLMLYLAGLSIINTGATIQLAFVATVVVTGVITWRRGFLVGLTVGLLTLIAFGLTLIFFDEVTFEVLLFLMFTSLPYFMAERLAGPWSGVITGALSSLGWIAAFITAIGVPFWPTIVLSIPSIFVGLTLPLWGTVLIYPLFMGWNICLRWVDGRHKSDQPPFFRWHSAFWDEHQRLPLLGLDEHLLLVIERHPAEGQLALDYLSTSRQRWAAQSAQIELDARLLAGCTDVHAIGQAHRNSAAGELEGPVSALLRSFNRISRDVDAALSQTSAYNQRLALSAIEDRLDSLLRELTRSSERYAARFRPIATGWRQVLADYAHHLTEMVELHQEIDNPYVIGVPLTEQQEIFVGRTDISARIEQLLLDRRRPPLLLYGQRRMGKTSLLNNLGRLLPSTIVPFFVDLQGPASQASDHAGFFYNIARGMTNSARRQRDLNLPPLSREVLAADPFTSFDEWLDEVEQVMNADTALVTLDEFEALHSAIDKGNLDGEALLNMMRHLIQHRPRFKILITSSQSLDSFKRWSSYLINIQVVYIGYLSQAETRQLIERPVKDFALTYQPEAIQRVVDLTRGHPFLVQLLCGEIVALKNEQDHTLRRQACLADVEAVVPEALNRGSFFFADIERNQVDTAGLLLLRFLANQGEGALVDAETLSGRLPEIDNLDQTLDLLTRRELIETVNGRGYRFQVELIRRWFARPTQTLLRI